MLLFVLFVFVSLITYFGLHFFLSGFLFTSFFFFFCFDFLVLLLHFLQEHVCNGRIRLLKRNGFSELSFFLDFHFVSIGLMSWKTKCGIWMFTEREMLFPLPFTRVHTKVVHFFSPIYTWCCFYIEIRDRATSQNINKTLKKIYTTPKGPLHGCHFKNQTCTALELLQSTLPNSRTSFWNGSHAITLQRGWKKS